MSCIAAELECYMKKIALLAVVALISIAVGLVGGYVFATAKRTAGGKPVYAVDGTVHVPAFDLPPSVLASKEVAGLLQLRSLMVMPFGSTPDIAQARQGVEKMLSSTVKD